MDFSMLDNGADIDVVCRLVVFDHDHEAHLMILVNSKQLFHYDGLLTEGFDTYTVFGACMVQQYPIPKFRPSLTPGFWGMRDLRGIICTEQLTCAQGLEASLKGQLRLDLKFQ
jgi:hypothetical protein